MQSEALPSAKIVALCGKRTRRTSFCSRAPCAAGKWLMKRCELRPAAMRRRKAEMRRDGKAEGGDFRCRVVAGDDLAHWVGASTDPTPTRVTAGSATRPR